MNIYELLNKIIINEKYSLSSELFIQEDREQLCDDEKKIFDLLKNISSICTKIYNTKVEFHPKFVRYDGGRTYSVDDITEDDYRMLLSLELENIPLLLRALISDILWVYKKDYNSSIIAANAYWNLFNLFYKPNDGICSLDMIRRAVCISSQTKQTKLYGEICLWFDSFLKHDVVTNNGFFSLRVMELFAEQKNFDVSVLLTALDEIINTKYDDFGIVEQAYKLKSKILFKTKNNKEANVTNLLLADYYLESAEKIANCDIQGALRSESYYKKGISLYRNNGETQKAEDAHRRLVEIQKTIPKIINPVSVKFDISCLVENIKKNMSGLTFEESLIRLTQMVRIEKKDDIKKRVINEYKQNPILYMFSKNLKNSQGQTVVVLPPLDLNNPEDNLGVLELHMYQSSLEHQKMVGDIWIKNALSILRENYSINNGMLDFLVKDNIIIPEGRERIFKSGLRLFLNGEYYEAMHILAPQTENLFRNIAREVGGLTVTLENDGSSMEKVLSSIFSLPELVDCYDNDILFTFKGLLNEQAGANIRNEIAHGIISEYECSSGVCLYFGAAIIKLLSYTSKECYRIFNNSEKLKMFEEPNKEILKVIQEKDINQ